MSTAASPQQPPAGPATRNTASDGMQEYAPDLLSRRATILGLVVALFGGGIAALLAWLLLDQTSLPAFNTSMVTRALSTAGTVVIVGLVGAFIVWWLFDEHRANDVHDRAVAESEAPATVAPVPARRPRWRVALTYVISYLAPAGLVVTALAIPLSATRLYLDGLQVDQGFRTQFLTRMAETWQNQDMNYIDMPTYYPIGWFWLGGRLANLLGISGWEVYQPWAIVSLAAVASMLVPLWQRLVGSLPVAVGVALVTTAITLVMTAVEPYAAVIAMLTPALTLLTRRALLGSWWAAAGMAIALGVAASFYTLYTGAVALAVVVAAGVLAAVVSRRWKPILRLVVIGLAAILIALISWGPFLLEVLSGAPTETSAAQHYLPAESTQIPVPFLAPSVVGLLCLIGVIYFVVRFRNLDVRMMAIATVVFYGWALASMAVTLAGTTLLGFRMDTLIVLQLATAGVLALAELRLVGVRRLYPRQLTPRTSRTITLVAVILILFGGVHYAQQIPARLEGAIDNAYTDTDGYGERADRYAPDAGQYYAEIDAEIRSHGHEPTDTVVITDEVRFLSFRPYHGFNAFTAHYANPLGMFNSRNAVIEQWAADSWGPLSDPADFSAALQSTPWRGPDVFIFRGDIDDPNGEGWKTHIARDLYPNQPNVRYDGLFFNPDVFADESLWATSQIGPFVVVTRNG